MMMIMLIMRRGGLEDNHSAITHGNRHMGRIMTPGQFPPLGPLVGAEDAETHLGLEALFCGEKFNGIVLENGQEPLVRGEGELPVRVMFVHVLDESREDCGIPAGD